MVLALAIISNILWFSYSVWQNINAKKERDELNQDVLDISLDCMARLQARNPGDYKLLSDAKAKFEKIIPKPISTEEMKAKVLEKTKSGMKSIMDSALEEHSSRAQAIRSGRGMVI